MSPECIQLCCVNPRDNKIYSAALFGNIETVHIFVQNFYLIILKYIEISIVHRENLRREK